MPPLETNPVCFGSFQPEGECLNCAASLWCSDYTMRLDIEAMEREDGAMQTGWRVKIILERKDNNGN